MQAEFGRRATGSAFGELGSAWPGLQYSKILAYAMDHGLVHGSHSALRLDSSPDGMILRDCVDPQATYYVTDWLAPTIRHGDHSILCMLVNQPFRVAQCPPWDSCDSPNRLQQSNPCDNSCDQVIHKAKHVQRSVWPKDASAVPPQHWRAENAVGHIPRES